MSYQLFKRLCELNEFAAAKWPANFDQGIHDFGFGHIGLMILENPRREGYWCTPLNSLAFAVTGGDGVHYSFLIEPGQSTYDAPVIMTDPSDCGESIVIGADLHDFLCLGCQPRSSFFAWGTEHQRPPQSNQERESERIGQEMVEFLREELDLRPWTEHERRFQELETMFGSKIIYPPTMQNYRTHYDDT